MSPLRRLYAREPSAQNTLILRVMRTQSADNLVKLVGASDREHRKCDAIVEASFLAMIWHQKNVGHRGRIKVL